MLKRSQAQIEASRNNGKKSNGPITEEGKNRSKMNAVKHGLFLTSEVMHGIEDPEQYEALKESLFEEFEPETRYECALIESVGNCLWRLRRIELNSQKFFTCNPTTGEAITFSYNLNMLLLLNRNERHLTRTRDAALKTFLQLKKERMKNKPKDFPFLVGTPQTKSENEPENAPNFDFEEASYLSEDDTLQQTESPVPEIAETNLSEIEPPQSSEPKKQKNEPKPSTEKEFTNRVFATRTPISELRKIPHTGPSMTIETLRRNLYLEVFKIEEQHRNKAIVPGWFLADIYDIARKLGIKDPSRLNMKDRLDIVEYIRDHENDEQIA